MQLRSPCLFIASQLPDQNQRWYSKAPSESRVCEQRSLELEKTGVRGPHQRDLLSKLIAQDAYLPHPLADFRQSGMKWLRVPQSD